MILESVDLLLRAAYAGTYKALAAELHCHPSTVGDKVSYALVIFKRATGAEYTNLNPKGILTGFEKLCAIDSECLRIRPVPVARRGATVGDTALASAQGFFNCRQCWTGM